MYVDARIRARCLQLLTFVGYAGHCSVHICQNISLGAVVSRGHVRGCRRVRARLVHMYPGRVHIYR